MSGGAQNDNQPQWGERGESAATPGERRGSRFKRRSKKRTISRSAWGEGEEDQIYDIEALRANMQQSTKGFAKEGGEGGEGGTGRRE